jgi:SAM-dependent methyltransferase
MFQYLPSEPWLFDKLLLTEVGSNTQVDFVGWGFPDPELAMSSPGQVLLNGKPFAQIKYPIYREDVGKVFWQRKNSACSGFECTTVVPTSDLYPNGAMELTFVNPGPPRLIPAQQSWFKPDPAIDLPLPDEARRFRVIGSTDAEHFTRGGFTDFKRLEAAVHFFTGKGFGSGQRILDFGCGCGRLARYLNPGTVSPFTGFSITGIDIDADNIAWCNANLNGKFIPIALNPPTPFPPASFDLIYGISVFTHLREKMQDAWLTELFRLSAPNAYLFMTVHGRTALDYAWQGPDVYHDLSTKIRQQGLYVSDVNHQLDGHTEKAGEYVNVFHDLDYLRNRWSQYFEIVEILPGYIYTHDLVVMRRSVGTPS